jgi:hypothetical protein
MPERQSLCSFSGFIMPVIKSPANSIVTNVLPQFFRPRLDIPGPLTPRSGISNS